MLLFTNSRILGLHWYNLFEYSRTILTCMQGWGWVFSTPADVIVGLLKHGIDLPQKKCYTHAHSVSSCSILVWCKTWKQVRTHLRDIPQMKSLICPKCGGGLGDCCLHFAGYFFAIVLHLVTGASILIHFCRRFTLFIVQISSVGFTYLGIRLQSWIVKIAAHQKIMK